MSTVAARSRSTTASCDPAVRVTRSLLGYGVLAGPFYVAVVLVQALIRPGFDLSRHDVSLLSNGGLGWIQIADFVLTGAMVVAFAAGVRRALARGRAATAVPTLLAIYGAGLIGAGIFVADPMNGFPDGAPQGMPTTVSVHGLLHIVCAGIGFLALVAACLVMARRFASAGERRSAGASIAVGVAFLLGFAGLASGSSSRLVVIGFWMVLLAVWAWMAWLAVLLYRQQPSAAPAAGR